MIDTMLNDGLMDKFHGIHMGITAENIAEQWSFTREEQDEFALRAKEGQRELNRRGYLLRKSHRFLCRKEKETLWL